MLVLSDNNGILYDNMHYTLPELLGKASGKSTGAFIWSCWLTFF